MKRISVFCGSSMGNDPTFREQAFLLGKTFAEQDIELVYGGAKVGLMGSVADGVLNAGGKAIGVLPFFMQDKEIAHEGLSELIFVDSMHERKAKMDELCDGVIALPGGFGTLDELFEMLTWGQLGLHQKPIGVLNFGGFYDHLFQLLEKMVAHQLLKTSNQAMLLESGEINELLEKMRKYVPLTVGKWIDKGKS